MAFEIRNTAELRVTCDRCDRVIERGEEFVQFDDGVFACVDCAERLWREEYDIRGPRLQLG